MAAIVVAGLSLAAGTGMRGRLSEPEGLKDQLARRRTCRLCDLSGANLAEADLRGVESI